MKLGVSSYSLFGAMKSGEMSILDVVQWVADNGGEHIEIVPIGDFTLDNDPGMIEAIRKKADEAGIEVSHYTVGANFVQPDEQSFQAEIARVKKQVDIARDLGVKRMRHDVASRPIPEATIVNFLADLPKLVEACRDVADYAAQFGITTSVENHGYYTQASDRVQALVHAVDRSNFRTLVDIGNFMCADENSVAAVKKNLPIASAIHLKDFYLRPGNKEYGDGWFPTASGNVLRGAIVGQGDIDMWEVIRTIKQSGYDGYISIEFEGKEPCTYGTKTGLEHARRIWDSV
jgi:sugar phosphate isomerase/epimerase